MKTMFYGGSIITMEDENPCAEAVMTENGKITFKGSCEEVYKNADKSTVMYNLNGRTMILGFGKDDEEGFIKAVTDDYLPMRFKSRPEI